MARRKSQSEQREDNSELRVRPLTPRMMNDFASVVRGTWGSSCWCMYPRLTDVGIRELPGSGPTSARRREAMVALARRRRAPGLIAFDSQQAVGWVAVGPRSEYARLDRSRATPRVDAEAVWVIPCITVRKDARGRGIAVALITAAVGYAASMGAPAVEAYPRAGSKRTDDDNVYFGTEAMFRRAGFKKIREPIKNLPRNWVARATMRIVCNGSGKV